MLKAEEDCKDPWIVPREVLLWPRAKGKEAEARAHVKCRSMSLQLLPYLTSLNSQNIYI